MNQQSLEQVTSWQFFTDGHFTVLYGPVNRIQSSPDGEPAHRIIQSSGRRIKRRFPGSSGPAMVPRAVLSARATLSVWPFLALLPTGYVVAGVFCN